MNHQKEKHPKTDKQLLKEFYGGGAMPVLLVLIGVSILAVILIVSGYVSDMIWENALSEKDIEFNKFCTDLVENMPEIKFFWDFLETEPSYIARGDYIINNLESFKKCQYTIQLNSLVDEETRIERFRASEAGK